MYRNKPKTTFFACFFRRKRVNPLPLSCRSFSGGKNMAKIKPLAV
jgi:hypothetical protein